MKFTHTFFAELFLVVLSTIIFVYVADGYLLKEFYIVSEIVWGCLAFFMVISSFVVGAYLYSLRDRTPAGSFINNENLLYLFIGTAIFFSSGVSMENEWISIVLDNGSLVVFYFVGMRMLQIPVLSEDNKDKTYV